MVQRFLAGYHPYLGRMGVWLTRPGIDVYSGTLDEHFLLSTDYKNPQVFLTGAVAVGAFGQQIIYFPEPLDRAPRVSFNCSVADGNSYYPFRADQEFNIRGQAESFTGYVLFTNFSAYALAFYYRVMTLGIG